MLVRDKEFARSNNAKRVPDELHDTLIEEALRREAFDHVEHFEVPDDSFDYVESDDECESDSD